MEILRAYKTKLDPTNKQCSYFRQCAGAARFVFNYALADRKRRYEEEGLNTNMYEQKRRFNAWKQEEAPWLYGVPYTLQEQEFRNVDTAFQNFFRRVKKGEKPGYPRFKRRSGRKHFQLRGCIHVETGQVKLPRIGWVRLKEIGYLPTNEVKILSATISERAERWYVSLQVKEEIKETVNGSTLVVGVDFGIKTLAVLSNGKTFDNPHALREAEKKLARLQRELARRKKGSTNREKTKTKIGRCYAKISAIRHHALHDVSHYCTVTLRPKRIVLENLNVRGMLQNRHLSKAISDAAFSELRRQIEYKAQWHGIEVVTASTWYPSSKTCSRCGYVKDRLTLADRTFQCEHCGLVIDRDSNAARNLAALGVEP